MRSLPDAPIERHPISHDRSSIYAVRAAHTAFAISRSLNFWIFPVEVYGNSANTM
jgi:hypothetical protein